MNIISLTIALLLSQSPLLDDFGDSLPPGAIKRLGSIRWRHTGPASGEMFFSGDGKILYSGGGYDSSIRAWDVATGRERFRFKTPEPERLIEFAISKDGKYLACHGYVSPQNDDDRIQKQYTHFFDATTGEHLSAWEERSQAKIALSSNGSLLATCLYREQVGEVILVRNTKTGAIQCEWHEEKGGTLFIRFMQDDQRLLVIRYSNESNEPMSLFVLDARDGKTLRKRVLERMRGISYFAISPDDQRLVYLDRDGDQIRIEELLTGKLLKSFPKDKPDVAHRKLTVGLKAPEKDDSNLRFQFSPNGQLLSIVYGHGGWSLAPLRLQIFETATMQKKQDWEITQRWLGYTAFSTDNRIVAVNSDSNAIRLYDIASGQPLNDVEQNPPADPRDCCFSPDGKLLAIVGLDRYIDLWDTATWQRRVRWPTSHGLTSCVAFSPDGTKLFTGSHAHEAAIWETSTGKQLHKLLHPQLSWIEHGAWADHGKKVVFTGVGSLQVFDAETGAWHATYQDRRGGNSTCDFSRNGNLFVYQMDVLSLASASTGAILDQLPEAKNLQALRLAPHQQTIAANHQDRTLRIWELSTHGIRWQAKTRAMNNFTTVLAFSNDGRWIASGQGWQYSSEPKEITIYNADTGVPRCRFPGQPALHKMVFSPNDHQLVSFSADGTGLVWAVPPLPATAPWSKDEGARNWDLLAHQDAAQAAPAVARFLETNTETIAFFQAKLAPIPAVAPQIIRDWITQLDSGKFADREKAFQELAKLGGLAEPVLQEAKTKTLGAEGQRRVMMLLQQIQNKELTAAERQALRAAEITVRINCPAARQLLQAWSQGASDARLTKKASELLLINSDSYRSPEN